MNDANNKDLETRLSRVNLASSSDDYLERGLDIINTQASSGFWVRHLPSVLATALVISVSANVFLLVSKPEPTSETSQQLVQCNTPAAAYSPLENATGREPDTFATSNAAVATFGMC